MDEQRNLFCFQSSIDCCFFFLDEGLENSVVGGSNTSDRVPAFGAIEASKLSAPAACGCLVISLSHIIEGPLGLGGLVNPRVQESERRIASVESLLVEKRNNRGESWGRGGCSTNSDNASSLVDLESFVTKSRDIRSASARSIVSACLWKWNSRTEVGFNVGGLLRSGSKDVRESSSRFEQYDCHFGSRVTSDKGGCANRGDIGACGGERWVETAVAGGEIKLAGSRTTSSGVATGKDNADTTGSENLEVSAQTIAVRDGGIVSLLSVADGMDERGLSFVLDLGGPFQEIVPKVEVRHRVEPSSNVGDDTDDILDVKACFKTRVGGVVGTDDVGDGSVGGVGNELLIEILEVLRGEIFGLEFGDSTSILWVRVRDSVGDVVTCANDGRGDGSLGEDGSLVRVLRMVRDFGMLVEVGEADEAGHEINLGGEVRGEAVWTESGIKGSA